MKSKLLRNGLIVMTFFTIIGFGTYAFAGWGSGCPRWGGQGIGWDDRENNSRRFYASNDFTDTEIQKLREAQEKFRNDTDDLRQEIYAKQMELRSELAQKDPDAKKVLNTQKALSKLKAQFDEKRLMHQLALKDINPKLGRNYGGKGGPGYGPRGGGYCWQ